MNLKNLFFAALAAFSAMTFYSCGPKEFNLSTKTPDVSFDEKASTDTIVINGSDGKCELEFAPAWVTAEVQDSVVVLKVQANNTGKPRKDALIVKCGASNISINLQQGIKATHLDLPNGAEVTIPREGGSAEVVVVTDGMLKVEPFEGVETEYNNGKLVVKAPKNDGKRIKGVVKLTAGEFAKEVKVTVDGEVCATCKGTGKVTCKACGGQGNKFYMERYGIKGCSSCGGRGWSYRYGDENFRNGSGKQTCPTCKGEGA